MTPQKRKVRTERARKLLQILRKHYPNAGCALNYKTPWELLVGVQLSAQATDAKVNEITPYIFKKYKNVDGFAKSKLSELQKEVSSVLYYRNKARNIKGAAEKIVKEFGGKVPRSMEEMITLSGMGRKSSNVVLSNAMGIVEGIVVDTHVIRFARRFDLTDFKDAVRIERDLMEIIPKKHWLLFSYTVWLYGKEYGNPRGKRELHEIDPLISVFHKAKNYWPK